MRLAWLVVVAACDLQRMESQPRCTADGTLDGAACNRVMPEGIVAYADVAAPPPQITRELLRRGRDRYDRFCAACHGVDGTSDSEVGRRSRRRIPSLMTPAMRMLGDERILASIERGIGDMPRQPLSDRDRWAVLHYMRVLQARDVPRTEVPWPP
jgi:mono/diheme cytochrome c family protein